MPYYSYGGYVYFNDSMDAPKEIHNHFILNEKLNIYITSLSKFMDDSFTSLPKLFIGEIIKMAELLYQSCVSVINSCKMEQKQSTDGKMYIAREEGEIY